jgi:hypothetical protein
MLRINTFTAKDGKQHAYIRFIKDFNLFQKYRELMRVIGPKYMRSYSIDEICNPKNEKSDKDNKEYFFSHQTNFCVANGPHGLTNKPDYALISVHIETTPVMEVSKMPADYVHSYLQKELLDGLIKMGVAFIIITQIDISFYPVNTAGLLLALGVTRERAMEFMKKTGFNVTEKLLYYLGEIPSPDSRDNAVDEIGKIIETTSSKIKELTNRKWGGSRRNDL